MASDADKPQAGGVVPTILGIHSNVTNGDKTGGHAWISLTENGATRTYGLWPDSHPRVVDNGPASDLRTGMEDRSKPAVSRYYLLSPRQLARLKTLIARHASWGYTNNCASWASETVSVVVGEDVSADDWGLLGAETPRKLGATLTQMEAKDPTSRFAPKAIAEAPARSARIGSSR
jgi:hypothetical protein